MPEPEAPMMVTTSPGATSRLMSLSTTLEPNDLRRPSTRMSGSAAGVWFWSMVIPYSFGAVGSSATFAT